MSDDREPVDDRVLVNGSDERLLDRLPSGERTPMNLQVALVATLLEAAHASGTFQPEEITRISSGLSTHLGISDAAIGNLIEISELLRKEPGKRDELFADVAINFSLAQRQELLSIVWRILIIDGKVEMNEAEVAVEIRKALGLSMEAAVGARLRAEQTELEIMMKSIQKPVEEEEE